MLLPDSWYQLQNLLLEFQCVCLGIVVWEKRRLQNRWVQDYFRLFSGGRVRYKAINVSVLVYLFRKLEECLFSARPSSPINTQIEMDITSRQNSITFEPSGHYHSTKGIHVQNVCLKISFTLTSHEHFLFIF